MSEASSALDVLLTENRRFPPSEAFRRASLLNDPAIYDRAEGDPEAGAQVFTEVAQPSCGSCHTYGPAGTSAQVGPNLDEVLPDLSPEEIHEAIVDPHAQIAEGFSAGIMPSTYGDSLDEQQLADLVAFLTQGG
jgi:cytochrome c6